MGRNIMRSGKAILAIAILASFAGTVAHAQEKGCILLKTVAEGEQEVTDDRNQKTTKLVAIDKVVPGSEVIYTVTATNVCDANAQAVVIDNPVPEHMNYIANSAIGPGTEITFSVDGGFNYGKPETLTLSNPDGSKRPAQAGDYTNIRWVMRNPLKPGAVAFARFRALLE